MRTTVCTLALSLVVCIDARVQASARLQPGPDQDDENRSETSTRSKDRAARLACSPGPDGVLMVDAQFAPLSDKIVAAIKQISDGRIRFLVNTQCTATTPAATRTSASWARPSWRARTARAA